MKAKNTLMNHFFGGMAHKFRAVGLLSSLLLLPMVGQAATWKPDPSLGNAAQHSRLYEIGRRYGDEHFDEAVSLTKNKRNPQKSSTHMLRESAYYAYGLLLTGDGEDRQRAEKIIRQIISRQDLKTDSPTYGCLPPNFEDDWKSGAVIDPNYTQFVGSGLGEILDLDRREHNVLSKDLRQQLENSFRLAVLATMRRDVDPGYTNISLLSAAVGAMGDKLMGIPGARDFALSKLYWVLTRAQPGTTFTEYLSPTYYGVDLQAAYLARKYAGSPELATAANRMIDFLWKDIAASYHAPTFQLAGPHSRSYGVDMTKYAAGLKYFLYMALDGQYPLVDVETDHDWDSAVLTTIADLRVEVRPEFKATPPQWREATVRFRGDGSPVNFRQYRDGNLILGSMCDQTLWQQQRNVVAYWPGATPDAPVRFFQDMSPVTFGNGYAHFFSVQSKGAVLVAMTGKQPVPAQGGLQLGFNHDAQIKPLANGPAGAYTVEDAGVTATVYPVTQTKDAMTVRTTDDVAYLERSWAAADVVGNYNVLSYLVVFQTQGEASPVVKNLSFMAADGKATMTAEVDGVPLSLQVTKG